MNSPLPPAQRAIFLGLADALVPAAEAMPAASEVGIADDLLAEALNYRPDLFGPLQAILKQAQGRDPALEVRRLASEDPDAMHVLGLLVAGGYYLSDTVRALIGYPGQERRRIDPEETAEYVANGMLARVAARPKMWRAG